MITVSRAMNTPEQVSEAKLAKIRAVVDQLGYVPNRMAGGLKSARSRLVMALVPSLSSQVFTPTVQALTEALEQRGYHLMLGQSGYEDSREDHMLEAIIGRRPDGIVLTGVLHSQESRKRLIASGIPVVETWDYSPSPIDMLVGFSHDRVGEEVCTFLARQGRRHLALVTGSDARAMRRRDGFVRSAARLGLPPPRVAMIAAPATHANARVALAALLDAGPPLDAVFCSSDLVALGVLNELQSRGLSVPGAVAIVGFGDLAYAASMHPSLSTIRIDGARLGRLAAELIVQRAEGREVDEPVIDLGFELVERDSTGGG